MNLKTDLTKLECDKCRELCNFTEDELSVFNLKTKNKSIVEISLALNMSESAVSRRLSNIKKKVARVL